MGNVVNFILVDNVIMRYQQGVIRSGRKISLYEDCDSKPYLTR